MYVCIEPDPYVTANCNRLQWRTRTMVSVEHKESSLVTVQHQLV